MSTGRLPFGVKVKKTPKPIGVGDIFKKVRDWMKLWCCRRPAGGEGQSARSAHFLMDSNPTKKQKNPMPFGIGFFWQRMRDSNPRERSQSPVCYRYTNPL